MRGSLEVLISVMIHARSRKDVVKPFKDEVLPTGLLEVAPALV